MDTREYIREQLRTLFPNDNKETIDGVVTVLTQYVEKMYRQHYGNNDGRPIVSGDGGRTDGTIEPTA